MASGFRRGVCALLIISCAFEACTTERNATSQAPPAADSASRQLSQVPTAEAGEPSSDQLPPHICRPAASGALTIRDTSDYQNDNGGGRVGLLYLGDRFVDSVDIDFGVHAVGKDSLVFLPVIADDIDDHIIYDGASCVKLASTLPYLDSYFSSPSIANNDFRYWGLKKLSDTAYAIYAMRFRFRQARLDSLPLDTVRLATDYRFYFAAPRDTIGGAQYMSQAKIYVVDSSFARILSEASVVPPAT